MVVQDIAYAMHNQNEIITVVAENSKAEVELNTYLLKRVLATAEGISANGQMRVTIKDNDFEAIRKKLGL